MPQPPITRPAAPSDLHALAHIIGTAFADDPVSHWAMGAPALVRPALPRPRIEAQASYLITGGFGAFGLATARWLAIASVMGIPAESVDRQTPLPELGMDSLMAVELNLRVTTALGVEVPALEFTRGGGLNALAARLLRRMEEAAARAG